jgi:hypothetical protein
MGTGLAANMLTELQGQSRVVPTLKLTLAGTDYLFAGDAVASASQGQYKRCIPPGGWGELVRTVGGRENALSSASMNVTIKDLDRTLSKVIGGAARGTVVGSTASVDLRSQHVASGDHYQIFSGVIDDYGLVGDLLWRFILRGEDSDRLSAANNIPTINAIDFPNAPTASLGLPMQVVYGRHVSDAVTDATGMVSTICVDSTNDWFLVSYCVLNAFHAAWRDGVYATADFVMEDKSINGRYYTIVRDTAGTSTATSEITVDVDGLDTSGEAIGTLIDNPATQLEHFLTNFVFGFYPDDSLGAYAWLSAGDYPINETHFTTSEGFFNDRDIVGSIVIDSNDKAIDIINKFCLEYQMYPFWSWDWKVAVLPNDYAELDIYNPTANIRHEHARSKLTSKPLTKEVVNRITVDYLLNDATGELTKQNRIVDANRTPIISSSRDFTWDKGYVG